MSQSPETLIVIPPGTAVRLGGDVEALVTAVTIYPQHRISYCCTWWDGNVHNDKWLEACEVQTVGNDKLVIGFGS